MIVTSHSLAWVNFYRRADWIPVLGQFTNLAVLFQKYLLIPRGKPDKIQINHIYRYIKERSVVRSIIIIALPIAGNLIIAIVDLCKYLRYKILENQEKKWSEGYREPELCRKIDPTDPASNKLFTVTPRERTLTELEEERERKLLSFAKEGITSAIHGLRHLKVSPGSRISKYSEEQILEFFENAALTGNLQAIIEIARYHIEKKQNLTLVGKMINWIKSQKDALILDDIVEIQFLYAKAIINVGDRQKGIKLLEQIVADPTKKSKKRVHSELELDVYDLLEKSNPAQLETYRIERKKLENYLNSPKPLPSKKPSSSAPKRKAGADLPNSIRVYPDANNQ